MSRPANSFQTLSGVPVHYDRRHQGDYGTRGAQATFHVTNEFEAKLDTCFEQLWELSPFGRAEVITSAGAWVNKPGFHGLGRALDLDGIFWRDKSFVTLFDGFQGRDRRLYLAVEAVLRMHFGQVLNYDFNAAHRDHFHIDDVAPGFRANSKTAVFFVQNALSFVLGHSVSRDGVFGPETDGALVRALSDLGISGSISNLAVWRRFLMGVVRTVFQAQGALPASELPLSLAADLVAPAGESFLSLSAAAPNGGETSEKYPTADELLRNVYAVIEEELGGTSLKPRIEGAVTALANHPELQTIVLTRSEEQAPAG
jgi:hypothetical protein